MNAPICTSSAIKGIAQVIMKWGRMRSTAAPCRASVCFSYPHTTQETQMKSLLYFTLNRLVVERCVMNELSLL